MNVEIWSTRQAKFSLGRTTDRVQAGHVQTHSAPELSRGVRDRDLVKVQGDRGIRRKRKPVASAREGAKWEAVRFAWAANISSFMIQIFSSSRDR